MTCSNEQLNTGSTECGPEINNLPPRTVYCNKQDVDYFKSICAGDISVVHNSYMKQGVFYATKDCDPQYLLKPKWTGYNYFEPPPVNKILIAII